MSVAQKDETEREAIKLAVINSPEKFPLLVNKNFVEQ
jgi:hypothetical protein